MEDKKETPAAGGPGPGHGQDDDLNESCQKNPEMSNQKADYTAVPNQLLGALAACRIPGEQMQCLAVIIRKTYGWHKRSDWIALNQFAEMTGINKPHVKRALNALVDRNIIVAEKGNKKHPSYRINKKFNQWKLLPKKVTNKKQPAEIPVDMNDSASNPGAESLPKKAKGVAKKGNPSLPKKAPTKEPITKETTTTTTEHPGCSCSCENSFEEKTPLASEHENTSAVDSNLATEAERYGLSEDQLEYINLETNRVHQAGQIRSTKSAYRHGLIKKAQDGLLDISGLDELRRQGKGRKPLTVDEKTIEEMYGSDHSTPADQVRQYIGNNGLLTDEMESMETIAELVDAYAQALVDTCFAKDLEQARQDVLYRLREERLPTTDAEAKFKQAWADKRPWSLLDLKPRTFFQLERIGRIVQGPDNSYIYHLEKMQSDHTNKIHIYPDGRVEREKALIY